MGLLSKLGGSIKEGLLNGVANGIWGFATGRSANTTKMSADDLSDLYGTNYETYGNIFYNSGFGLTRNNKVMRSGQTVSNKINDYPTKFKANYSSKNAPPGLEKRKSLSKDRTNYDNDPNYQINKDIDNRKTDILKIKLPDWTYGDFINERAIWQKGLSSILDEPAWFYFKIFFDFKTNHGLFGGLLTDTYLNSATNSAAKYLYSNRFLHTHEKMKDRINALYKFTSILSYINSNAPWYFKGIGGLDKVLTPVMNEFNKEKTIEIEIQPDAIDMRLATLMSLYNYACYDNILGKEIIPENLRKFNMTIILFQSPIRYLQTSYSTNQKTEFLGIDTSKLGISSLFGNGKVYYKSMNPNTTEGKMFANVMSMKVLSLYGCEFDSESMSGVIPGEINNETPFQLGKNKIKISYTYALEHTMNEFFGMMFGTDGFYFNQYSNFQTVEGDWNGYVNKQTREWKNQEDRYKTLSAVFDGSTQNGSILGIIDAPKKYNEAIDATEAVMNGVGETSNMISDLGTNFMLGLIGSSKSTLASLGNLYGDYGIESRYYKDKLEMLTNGVHERTQAPYTYTPDHARNEYRKARNYTAYNYKNDVDTVQRFNLTNWLYTGARDLGVGANNGIRDMLYGSYTTTPYTPDPYKSGHHSTSNTHKNNDHSYTTHPYQPEISNVNINSDHKYTTSPHTPEISNVNISNDHTYTKQPHTPEISNVNISNDHSYTTHPYQPEISNVNIKNSDHKYTTQPHQPEISNVNINSDHKYTTQPHQPEISSANISSNHNYTTSPHQPEISSVNINSDHKYTTSPHQPEISSVNISSNHNYTTQPYPPKISDVNINSDHKYTTSPHQPEISSVNINSDHKYTTSPHQPEISNANISSNHNYTKQPYKPNA